MNPFLNDPDPKDANGFESTKPAAQPGEDGAAMPDADGAAPDAPQDTQGKGTAQADRTRRYDADAWWSGQG